MVMVGRYADYAARHAVTSRHWYEVGNLYQNLDKIRRASEAYRIGVHASIYGEFSDRCYEEYDRLSDEIMKLRPPEEGPLDESRVDQMMRRVSHRMAEYYLNKALELLRDDETGRSRRKAERLLSKSLRKCDSTDANYQMAQFLENRGRIHEAAHFYERGAEAEVWTIQRNVCRKGLSNVIRKIERTSHEHHIPSHPLSISQSMKIVR